MTAYVELYLDQGATFNNIVNVTDDVTNVSLNLANYVIRSQMRRSYYSANASATFECSISNASTGEITMYMSSANTANLKAGRYLFDMEASSPGGVVTRILEGIITVTPEVTR